MRRQGTYVATLALLAVIASFGVSCGQEGQAVAAEENVLLFEDFSEGMDNWWVEGGVNTWVEDERLHMNANPEGEGKQPGYVATVWCKQEFSGDVKVEFDAHVVASATDVNNINFFLLYSDPEGTPLYETRESRADAGYKLYHVLNGNIFTFLNDTRKESQDTPLDERVARIRIRHCPGFELLAESYDYHCRQGVTYHIELIKQGTKLSLSVDGNLLLETEDPEPHTSGLIGLRTFRTYLWWDNIKVTQL